MNRVKKQSTYQFHKTFFISQKVLQAMQKNIAVKDNKKRMNINNFINIYANIYTCIICDKND